MVRIFTHIYRKNQPNVGIDKITIHGFYGPGWGCCRNLLYFEWLGKTKKCGHHVKHVYACICWIEMGLPSTFAKVLEHIWSDCCGMNMNYIDRMRKNERP